jgi:hypothetical protein
LLENVTPEGKADGVQPLNAVFENVGAGLPNAVAWKAPALPAANVVPSMLVMDGAWLVALAMEEEAWLVARENWESGALVHSVLRL